MITPISTIMAITLAQQCDLPLHCNAAASWDVYNFSQRVSGLALKGLSLLKRSMQEEGKVEPILVIMTPLRDGRLSLGVAQGLK